MMLELTKHLRSTGVLHMEKKHPFLVATHAIRHDGVTYWLDVRVIRKGEAPAKTLLKSHMEPYTVGLAGGAGLRNVVNRATWREVLRAIKNGAEPITY